VLPLPVPGQCGLPGSGQLGVCMVSLENTRKTCSSCVVLLLFEGCLADTRPEEGGEKKVV